MLEEAIDQKQQYKKKNSGVEEEMEEYSEDEDGQLETHQSPDLYSPSIVKPPYPPTPRPGSSISPTCMSVEQATAGRDPRPGP
ncbi:unnamed protein product [Boreogadus saida]